MKRVSFKAVAIGNITDIVATAVVSLPMMIYITLGTLGGPPSSNRVTEILASMPLFVALSKVLGALCSVLGGYVSARIAKHDELLNGALSSILCMASGVAAIINGSSVSPSWLHFVYLPLSPALGALGGFLCLHRMRARNAPSIGQ